MTFSFIQIIPRVYGKFSFAKSFARKVVCLSGIFFASSVGGSNGWAAGDLLKSTLALDAQKKGAKDSILLKVWHWISNHSLQNQLTPEARLDFLIAHPNWPEFQTLSRHLEVSLYKKYGDFIPVSQSLHKKLIQWFSAHPPTTASGAKMYARLLQSTNQPFNKVIKHAWYTMDISSPELWIKSYKKILLPTDHYKRAQWLFNQNKITEAKKLFPYLTKEQVESLKTRLFFLENKVQTASFKNYQDFGVHYEFVKWARRNKFNDLMEKLILLKKSVPSLYQDLYWRERNLLARRFLEAGEFARAYQVLKDHGWKQGDEFATAQWLKGWLLLSFLKKPNQALLIFEKLFKAVKMPISCSRAAYWSYRAAQASHNHEKAKKWLLKTAEYPATFYGQLACLDLKRYKRIALKDLLTLSIPEKEKKAFESNLFVKCIHLLKKYYVPERFLELFLYHFETQVRGNYWQKVQLLQLAHKHFKQSDLIFLVKKDYHPKMAYFKQAYPFLTKDSTMQVKMFEWVIAHSIARQESLFNPKALSHKGAIGLMQLILQTARETAAKHGKKVRNLYDGKENLFIGILHLRHLLEKFDNDFVLAIAAYNAGPNPVQEWLKQFGHPKDMGYLQWIELIPYYETRNYVQRVIENMTIYQTLLDPSHPFKSPLAGKNI